MYCRDIYVGVRKKCTEDCFWKSFKERGDGVGGGMEGWRGGGGKCTVG